MAWDETHDLTLAEKALLATELGPGGLFCLYIFKYFIYFYFLLLGCTQWCSGDNPGGTQGIKWDDRDQT